MQHLNKRSELRFISRLNSQPVPALAHAQISASSDQLGWKGLYLEVGNSFGCDVNDLMVDGHFVGLQLNTDAISIRTRAKDTWVESTMPSRTLWLHPEGTPFSIRHAVRSYWAGAVINGHFLDSVLGEHYELRHSYIVRDEVLSLQLQSLIELLRQQLLSGANDPDVAAALIRAFVVTLAKRHGAPAPPIPTGCSIAGHELKALQEWIERNLGRSLTVEAMAQRVGLSVAHFSREFKRASGTTPWSYVMERRVMLAHRQLRAGQPISTVAHDCGFADPSHLSRAIRARFGLPPSDLVKQPAE